MTPKFLGEIIEIIEITETPKRRNIETPKRRNIESKPTTQKSKKRASPTVP
ncbi:MAG: hypothetical protein MJ002_09390 [Paludibacteraceae bacterium]|nr:hypothetical protein [Paludibacteraceae bacterium]